jgi:hypothetical protein
MSDKILRSSLIRLASTLPKGSLERSALVTLLASTNMQPGNYYAIREGGGGYDLKGMWFLAQAVLKNGSMRGLLVTWYADSRVPEKAKLTQVDRRWADASWLATTEATLDPKVRVRFGARAL